jgi:hypothetical protein
VLLSGFVELVILIGVTFTANQLLPYSRDIATISYKSPNHNGNLWYITVFYHYVLHYGKLFIHNGKIFLRNGI